MAEFNESRMDFAARELQAQYDPAYQQLLNQRAPMRVFGESEAQFEARLQKPLQVKAASPLAKMDHLQARVAGIAHAQREALFNDVQAVARADASTGPLRSIKSTGEGGHKIKTWQGAPGACWAQFKSPTRFWTGITSVATSRHGLTYDQTRPRPAHFARWPHIADARGCIGKWNLPGGKIEQGEAPASAARRHLERQTAVRMDADPEPWLEEDELTILRLLGADFEPMLAETHDASGWVHPSFALSSNSLHPDARMSLEKLEKPHV